MKFVYMKVSGSVPAWGVRSCVANVQSPTNIQWKRHDALLSKHMMFSPNINHTVRNNHDKCWCLCLYGTAHHMGS